MDRRWIRGTAVAAVITAGALAAGPAAAETLGPGGGADTWTFYGYGNGYVMAQILEAIKRMADMPAFRTLVMVIAMAGFLIIGWMGLLGRRPERLMMYLGGLMLAIYLLFTLKVDIYVEDMVWDAGGAPQFGQQVQDVPAAIGLPAVVISEVGMWATRAIETHFTRPDFNRLRLSEGAPFGMTAGVLNDLGNIRLSVPWLRGSIQTYIYDCVLPDVFAGRTSAVDLVASEDVWSLMASQSPSRFTAVYGPDGGSGEILPCDEAYAIIDNQLQVYAPQLTRGVAGASPFWFQQAVGDTSLTEGAMEDAFRWASGGSVTQDATALATQSAMIEAYRGTYEYAAMATGSNELISALNIEQARRAQKTGWHTTAVLFRDMAGYFFAILQAFVIGVAPIIMAALVAPGLGLKMGGAYARVMVWLVLWWPGLAIVNYIMSLYLQDQTQGYLTAGLSMSSIGTVSEMADNMVLAAGFMATLVPAVMWGLVSATGMAFTSVLDRASGAGYAAQAAGATASGSASLGEVRMNNTAMNAHQTSHRYTSGFEGGQYHIGAGTGTAVHHMSGQETLHGLQQQTSTMTQGLSHQAEQATQLSREMKQEYTSAVQAEAGHILNQTQQVMRDNGYVQGGEYNWDRGLQNREVQQAAAALAALDRHMEEAGLSREERDEVFNQVSVQAGLGGGAGSGGGGLRGLISGGIGYQDGRRQSEAEIASQRESETLGHSRQAGHDERSEHADTSGESWRGSDRYTRGGSESDLQAFIGTDRLNELNTRQQQYNEVRSYQERLKETLSAAQNSTLVSGLDPHQVNTLRSDFVAFRRDVTAEMGDNRMAVASGGAAFGATVSGAVDGVEDRVMTGGADIEAEAAGMRERVDAGRAEHRGAAEGGPTLEDFERARFRSLDTFNEAAIRENNFDALEGFELQGQVYRPVSWTENGEVIYATHDGDRYDFYRNAGDGELEHLGYDQGREIRGTIMLGGDNAGWTDAFGAGTQSMDGFASGLRNEQTDALARIASDLDTPEARERLSGMQVQNLSTGETRTADDILVRRSPTARDTRF